MGVKRESLRSAWLVTWEWSGDHARVEDPVVALFNYRWPGETVRLVVEQIYSALKHSISDKFAVARNRKNTPYPAQARDIDGVPWLGEISCGNNPWLRARSLRMFGSRSMGTNVHRLSESTKNPVHA
jgi:hypothetical protein